MKLEIDELTGDHIIRLDDDIVIELGWEEDDELELNSVDCADGPGAGLLVTLK